MLSNAFQNKLLTSKRLPAAAQSVFFYKEKSYKSYQNDSNQHRYYSAESSATNNSNALKYGAAALGAIVSGSLLKFYSEKQSPIECASKVYSRDEVSKHKSVKNGGMWVIYQNNVYDITDFVENHPGGSSKISLAAGSNLEPYWDMYAFHKKGEVLEMLKEYYIGKLRKEDWVEAKKTEGPYATDPKRHPALAINSAEPFNAETPTVLAVDNLITPNDLFYVRNHMPVPDVTAEDFNLKIEGTSKCITLKVEDLKKNFQKVELVAAIQCAGNRRSEMDKIKKVKGLGWSHNAISNAKWGGVLLRDLLLAAGVDPKDKSLKHVHFEGADKDVSGGCYGASIPLNRIFEKDIPVIVAYEMNDQTLPRDHGFPLRIVAPGIVGARNVKWVERIAVSEQEYQGHWQQKDYKPFSSNIDWHNVDFSTAVSIQELPVTSAICVPSDGSVVHESEEEITFKGYAYSGGGRGILRVDVSVDGGKTWSTADLNRCEEQDLDSTYSWTLWECTLPIPEKHKGKVTVFCRAVDSSCNTQPDTVGPVWNLRGCLNNSWHSVEVDIDTSED